MPEQTFTREEIEGALLNRDVTDAVQAVLHDPGNKSKPGYVMAEKAVQAAIETAFGPK